jgi:hypothetical protein
MKDSLMENYRLHKVGINPPVIDRKKGNKSVQYRLISSEVGTGNERTIDCDLQCAEVYLHALLSSTLPRGKWLDTMAGLSPGIAYPLNATDVLNPWGSDSLCRDSHRNYWVLCAALRVYQTSGKTLLRFICEE